MMKARKFDKDFRVLLGMRNMLVTVVYFQMSVEKKEHLLYLLVYLVTWTYLGY